jgi:N-succinyldiaminopimelate aminotransferase
MPRYPHLSHAADGLSAGVYTSLLGLAQAHAPEIFALNVGDTYLAPPLCARSESLRCEDLPGLHNYASVRGEPALLAAIERDLAARERHVPAERLQVTSGATSGLDIISRAVLQSGDEVLVLAPYWPLIRGIISSKGALAVEVPFFDRLRDPGFDPERALEAAITPRTVAIYVNMPHNPTGVVLREDEIALIARVIEKHELWLFSDEAYESLSFGEDVAPIWKHPGLRERSFVAHTFSKSHGIAGARVGFVHGPQLGFEGLIGLQTFTTYCAARPMQIAAARALASEEGRAWNRSARQAYREAAAKTARVLGLAIPESGTFVCFDTRRFLRDGESPASFLERLARAGVVLTPGASIGRDYADWARLCFTSVAPAVLDRALTVLASELASTNTAEKSQ